MRPSRRDVLLTGPLLAAACGGKGDAPSCDTSAPCLSPGLPPSSYFEQLASELKDAELGTPQIVIDLDRLDANADAIIAAVGSDRYRAVEKSVPSYDLIDYVQKRTGSPRLMVMHLPFLPGLLARFPAAQVMVGKPEPTFAVKQVIKDTPLADLARVSFVADSRARLEGLIGLADAAGFTLHVVVDLDIGMHRSGVRDATELSDVLSLIETRKDRVVLDGLLGYDGHVPEAVAAPGTEPTTLRNVFKAAQQQYANYVDVLKTKHASLWRDDLRLNCGGTSTFPLYTSGPVNDVSAGGGLLRPSEYINTFISALRPAVFIATPVLERLGHIALPLIKTLSSTVFDGEVVTVYGGGWAAGFVWPEGIAIAPFTATPPAHLVQNQNWVLVPPSVKVPDPDDFVFMQPRASDAIFGFEQILLVRDGHLTTERWLPFPRRY
jgi:D-serine deaminase-like pyridoxal phosphate-dependent protein